MPKRITIKELAALLEVSPTTVSLVLGGKAETHRIASDTRRKIEDAAARLGYRPNHLAQAMRRGKTDTLGVIFPDVSEAYMNMVLRGIEQIALEKNKGLMIATSSLNPTVEARNIQMLLDRRIDGLLIIPYAPFRGEDYRPTAIQEAAGSGLPIVAIDRHIPDITPHAVIAADESASRQAAELLISKGCRHLAYLGFDLVITTLENRRKGFYEAAMNTGVDILTTEILLKELNINSSDLTEHLKGLAAENNMPDGFLVSTAGLALRLQHLMRTNNYRAAGKVPLIARFGEDLPYFPTGMIQIRQPHEELGRRAVKKLLTLIDGVVGKNTTDIEILPMEINDEAQHH
ncbi:MAG: LacI family DNA-binding transcriptional regulator [Spirochaetaceae bacterium]|nr:LacI family DNA-binding transcriptional regulator [Spirochaetaceae bacterium]MDT8296961.1 LacI family DNA-binding transcriptional regulator [Spirochaetaceae bacterium]